MQSVSAGFLTGILASERRILQHTEITLVDNPPNWTGASFSASSTLNATLTPAGQAFNGRNYPQRKFAWVGEDCFPAGDLYPVAPDGSSEVGWWSDNSGDADGNFAAPEWVAVDYGATISMEAVSVHCYKLWGYPLDPTIEYSTVASPGPGDWTAVAVAPRVDDASSLYYSLAYILPSLTPARHVRLTFQQWSKPNKRAKIIEVEPGWTIDISDRIKSISVTKERNATDEGSTLPFGNASANEINIEIDNVDGAFYQHNTTSPYYGYLKRNREVRLWFALGLDAEEYLPQGVCYTVTFGGARMSPSVKIAAWDKAKRMGETNCETFPIYEGKKISEVAQLLTEHYGLTVGDYSIEVTPEIIAYTWFAKNNYWANFQALAAGETGAVYFDESGVLVFENRYHIATGRLSAAATAGASSIQVDTAFGLVVGDTIRIDGVNNSDEAVQEDVVIDAAWNGTALTIPLTTTLTNSYKQRSYVYRASHPVVATYDDTNFTIDIDDLYTLDKSRNKIEVNAKPLRVPMAGGLPVMDTVWQMSDTDDPIILSNGEHIDIDITFESMPVISNMTYSVEVVITGEDMVTLAELTNDPSGALSHEWQDGGPFAWGGKLRIASTNANDANIIGILISGVTLEETGKIAGKAVDTSLTSWQGERIYTLTSNFIQKRSHAQALADDLLLRYKDMQPALNVEGLGLFHHQLADRIKINDSELKYNDANLNNHFFLTRIDLDYDGGIGGKYQLLAA
jgi:hypothetical protein